MACQPRAREEKAAARRACGHAASRKPHRARHGTAYSPLAFPGVPVIMAWPWWWCGSHPLYTCRCCRMHACVVTRLPTPQVHNKQAVTAARRYVLSAPTPSFGSSLVCHGGAISFEDRPKRIPQLPPSLLPPIYYCSFHQTERSRAEQCGSSDMI